MGQCLGPGVMLGVRLGVGVEQMSLRSGFRFSAFFRSNLYLNLAQFDLGTYDFTVFPAGPVAVLLLPPLHHCSDAKPLRYL